MEELIIKNISGDIEEYIIKLCQDKEISCFEIVKEIVGILKLYKAGIHITDGSGYTLFYNKEAEKIDGINSKNIIGKRMENLVDKGVFSHSVAIEVIEKKKEVSNTQRVGDKIVYTRGNPVFKNGEVFRVIISSEDMSELAKYESKLKELKELNETYKRELSISNYAEVHKNRLIAKSKKMKQIKDLALRVAKVNSTVLIEGETGVGKGLLSEYIHKNSLRNELQFLKIDCSSIPENLLEAELFGYEEGSFTGAREGGKIGLIELANRGTLFLDEIGELSLKLQAKLLRVIQDRVIYRIGGTEPIEDDIRIIAATNWNLLKRIEQGKFREDLYYRLSVILINIPPLRERKEDITPLIRNTLGKLNSIYSLNKEISPGAMKKLIDHKLPGNVRQLQNIIERLIVTTEGDSIEASDIGDDKSDKGKEIRERSQSQKPYKEQVLDFERNLLIDLMKDFNNLEEMAKSIGLSESGVRKKLNRLDIPLDF